MSDELPSADVLLAGIHNALQAHDMPAAAAMVRTLAVVDPHSAEILLLALDLAKRADT